MSKIMFRKSTNKPVTVQEVAKGLLRSTYPDTILLRRHRMVIKLLYVNHIKPKEEMFCK